MEGHTDTSNIVTNSGRYTQIHTTWLPTVHRSYNRIYHCYTDTHNWVSFCGEGYTDTPNRGYDFGGLINR